MERLAHGLQGYASILGVLFRSSATTAQLSSVMTFGGCDKSNRAAISRLLRRLQAMGIVHVPAWSREIGREPREVWHFGPGVNVPMPRCADGKERVRLVPSRLGVRSDSLLFGNIILALRDGHSALDLAELVGANVATIYSLIRHMRELGMLRVTEWHRQPSSNPRAVFMLGIGKDAPRPPPLPKSVTDRRYNEARRARMSGARVCAALAQASL